VTSPYPLEQHRVSTPELCLRTRYVFDEDGRILSTRPPSPGYGPAFVLVRGKSACAWAVHRDIESSIASELDRLAQEEPPISDLRTPPVHAERYIALVGGELCSGPAFTFPETLPQPGEMETVDELRQLEYHFTGWTADEIPDASPIVAVMVDGRAVSVCFCARRAGFAAEAGLETAPAFRGRGLGPRVASAWALAVRESGRIPLYSTTWTNDASLAVARKLGLIPYAATWGLSGRSRPEAYS